jgi:hypothetical protein
VLRFNDVFGTDGVPKADIEGEVRILIVDVVAIGMQGDNISTLVCYCSSHTSSSSSSSLVLGYISTIQIC